MTEVLLLLGYGLAASGTAINAPAWALLFWQRLHAVPWRDWKGDLYLTMRLALTVVSGSLLIPYATRIGEMFTGTLPSAPPIYVASIYGLTIGEALFVRATWINGQRLPGMLWVAACACWAGFVFLWRVG